MRRLTTRKKTAYPLGDDEWRKWMNQHFYQRQGVSFLEMSEPQRDSAFGLLRQHYLQHPHTSAGQ